MDRKVDELIELPWKKTFISVMRKKGLDKLVEDGQVCFSKNNDAFLKKNWAKITPYTLLDPFRMGVLLDLTEQVLDVKGDFVECGCFKGGTGLLIGLFFKEKGIDKKIHLFDSFEGLPDPNEKMDKGYRKGDFKSDFEELKQIIRQLNLEDTIVLHKGWFSDTTKEYVNSDNEIALLHIDCDLYDSTVDSYGPLKSRVCSNGVVVFDDFNDGGRGEKLAVEELLEKKYTMFIGPSPQVYYFNDQKNETHLICGNGGPITYCFDQVLANEDYLKWLSAVGKIDYKKEIMELCSKN